MPKTAWKNHLAKLSVCFSHSVTKDPGCARNHALLPLTFVLLGVSGFRLAGFHQRALLLLSQAEMTGENFETNGAETKDNTVMATLVSPGL